MPITPDDLESGVAALSARAPLEEEYRGIVEAEVYSFLDEVGRRAVDSVTGTALSLAAVLVLWSDMTDRIASKLPANSQLLAAVRESQLPGVAYEAAVTQLAEAATLNVSPSELRARVRGALGISRTAVAGLDVEYGRMLLGPDGGSVRSWVGESEAMARTSATADLGSSMIEQLRAEGYTHKRWMTRYDSRVRETHANVDRNTLLLDESFMVGGTALRYPADPMGMDLSQVINCRCVLVGVRYGRHELDQPYGETPWNNPRPARR